jgi:GNAT superfamily N-acetyltransferase
MNFQIRPFDLYTATQAEWAALNVLKNRIDAELDPDEPPESVEDHARRLRSLPPSKNLLLWVAWAPDDNGALGMATLSALTEDTNRHLAPVSISVLPEARCRGIATRLLRPVAEAARKAGRRLLMAQTASQAPGGEPFIRGIGGVVGLVNSFSRLELAGLDRDLMRSWRGRAVERAEGFEIGLWEGPYPKEDLDAVLAMILVMNTAPRGELDMGDFEPTADLMREWDTSMAESRTERWTIYVRHVESGKFAGYTEVFWNPARPETVNQGDTGVFPQYRNRGLGRWLKAAMVDRVLRDRPQVRRIRTENATSNAPMLGINREMGFVHYRTSIDWQVEVGRVFEYLGNRSA